MSTLPSIVQHLSRYNPALTDEKNDVKRLMWIDESFGHFHRFDGPAIIEHDYKGNVIYESWYINGIIIIDMNDWLKENNISEPYSKEDVMAIVLRWL